MAWTYFPRQTLTRAVKRWEKRVGYLWEGGWVALGESGLWGCGVTGTGGGLQGLAVEQQVGQVDW